MKILIVDDDLDLCANLVLELARDGFECTAAHNGKAAWNELENCSFDLMILDWNLPDYSGLELLKQHRLSGGTTRTLLLTGRGCIEDTLAGLEGGADDYLKKPFDLRELKARLKNLMRRPDSQGEKNKLVSGNISLDRAEHRVCVAGNEIELSPREFALLEFLLCHPRKILPSKTILKHVWTDGGGANTDALSTSVARLRTKLDRVDNPVSVVRNVHGVGYGIFPEAEH